MPMGFGGRIWRKRGTGFSGLESYSREEERENRPREKKTKENGRDREFLGFFFMNFQEEEGYILKKKWGRRETLGVAARGCAATP